MNVPARLLDRPSTTSRAGIDGDALVLVIDRFDHWTGPADADVSFCKPCFCWNADPAGPEPTA